MEYTLTMTFLTETGEKSNISISDVKAAVTNEEIQVLMDSLIANNIFENKIAKEKYKKILFNDKIRHGEIRIYGKIKGE